MRTVLLVDDHPLYRAGLHARLVDSGLGVVGEAASAHEAYLMTEERNPDVVVLDVSLPGESGIAAARELRRRKPGLRILMLSMHSDEDSVTQALSAGAFGYALKDQDSDVIIDAVLEVAEGRRYVAPRIAALASGTSTTQPHRSKLSLLSARERVVFDLLVRGHANDDIARELFISTKTVTTHRSHILQKLGLHSLAELVRFAARNHVRLDA